jgi:hypothetical protein
VGMGSPDWRKASSKQRPKYRRGNAPADPILLPAENIAASRSNTQILPTADGPKKCKLDGARIGWLMEGMDYIWQKMDIICEFGSANFVGIGKQLGKYKIIGVELN